MDPLTIGLAVSSIAGLGLKLFGGEQQAGVSKQQAKVSADIAQQEQAINQQKMLQANLEAKRSLLQNFRNAQRLRAQATAAAVNQGAQFGSGLAGGLAGVTSQSTENAAGINQGQQIGQNVFNLTSNISQDKQQLALLGGQAAQAQGISSLGGSLMQVGSILGSVSKGK